ncbi:MAG TPA: hypothetical protein VJJ52_04570 [Candidatus Nanoarchaeia archaeon]|nr:hypothetical protein [Candidatus Nanoarchaeia archaeon]
MLEKIVMLNTRDSVLLSFKEGLSPEEAHDIMYHLISEYYLDITWKDKRVPIELRFEISTGQRNCEIAEGALTYLMIGKYDKIRGTILGFFDIWPVRNPVKYLNFGVRFSLRDRNYLTGIFLRDNQVTMEETQNFKDFCERYGLSPAPNPGQVQTTPKTP